MDFFQILHPSILQTTYRVQGHRGLKLFPVYYRHTYVDVIDNLAFMYCKDSVLMGFLQGDPMWDWAG